MEEYLIQFESWVNSLGKRYGVNPLILGTLYFLSKVSMVSFLGWAFKRLRRKQTILVPVLLAAVSFSVPYTYIIIAGRNIPAWVYLFIVLMLGYGGFVIWRKVTTRAIETAALPETELTEKDI
ncbi:hypothetical protein DJ568_16665 [Mucilaginibacter hurinus]|uniref:Uncharacterized protein n=1 Tax=Mucilaginibacter hurinus TaxID=2201324 RepID=A0A367GL34_9SPHI|nr:hypothetical protein [Mucilaginibacter hurinus]RCH53668.1 hypothetical protein DJ568_16665 [Mucilaginibacter hurinus]